jgi:ornithine cyclodeaminase/alanine dehydrogenase-like protein (mu-crystallin family)
MTDVIEAVERGFREYKTGRCVVPVRMPVPIEKAEGIFLFMPAYLEKEGFFGTKIVSVFPGNIERKLSTIQAAYLLNDPTTGELLALIDGILLTAMRTGATSAVATKYLSRKNAETLGIIGAGAQAPFQAEAISKVRPIRRMLVHDKEQKIAENFSRAVSKSLQIPVHVMDSPRDVVVESDILVTVTTSKVPVFDGRDLKMGTHINAVGAYTPEMRELDDFTIASSKIVVDTYEGCMAEAGDLIIPMRSGKLSREKIYADLGEIVLEQKPARMRDDEITLFESVGFALEDLVVASLAYRKAKERGIGLEFTLG